MLTDMSASWMVASGCGGLLVTLIITPKIRSWALRHRLMDRVSQFHATNAIEVPRLGGMALAVAFLMIVGLIFALSYRRSSILPLEMWTVISTTLGMFALGFYDDLKPLSAKFKFMLQIVIASSAYIGGLRIGHWVNPFNQTLYVLGNLDAPLTVLWLVSVTNLINLIDGIDGLAAGLALLLMVLLSVVSVVNGVSIDSYSLLISVGMVGALLGFLFYNFPPAKIFMGDGGAYFLGMLIAELALLNSNKGEVTGALIAPFFALGLPIIDAIFTIFRRTMVGLPVFRADRRHVHHRLVAMGFSRQRVVLLLYAVSVFFGLLALAVLLSKGRLLPVLFGIFMIVVVLSARMFGFIQDWYKIGHLLSDSMLRRKQTRYAVLLGQLLLLEAEQSQSLDELWKHYSILLQKLHFREAVLHSADQKRQWKSSLQDSVPQKPIFQDLKGDQAMKIVFYCEVGKWDEKTLRDLTELAAEFWVKAANYWKRTHSGRS